MRRWVFAAMAFASAGRVSSALGDEGMWLINQPPMDILKQRYGFEPTAAWLEHVQKSCVKMGASGSLVSPDGLLMTNHHVGDGQIGKLSTKERDLLRDGFVAGSREQELRCLDMEVEVLQSIEDVTERVLSASSPDANPADAEAARRKRRTEIEQESKAATGLNSDVVALYHGARYHLYRYKRYTDVRLVMAPEDRAASFGGDIDNFEYPRFDLDVCFFRVYDDGKPLRCEHFLPLSREGAREGELTIALGHPARTNRQYTVDHLRFQRDVELPAMLRGLWRREVQLLGFSGRSDEFARIAQNDLGGVQNSRKARTGGLAALQDPALLARTQKAETELRSFVAADPTRQARWGDAWDNLAAALANVRTFHERHQLLNGRSFGGGSSLLRIARTLVRLSDELPKSSADRLREYRDGEMESVERSLYSTAPIYPELEADRLASFIALLAETLGGDDPLTTAVLAGMSPTARAEALVRESRLADVAVRREIAAGGRDAIEKSADPLIALTRLLDGDSRAVRRRYEDQFESVERREYERIGQARFALYGESIYPDATGTLRLSFGAIAGYEERGAKVPAFTTIGGMFARSEERRSEPPFDLPPRWHAARAKLNMDTPMNFVSTADIIGGNSGSPVVDRAGQVVGLIFDGNIQSLGWSTAYDDRQARAVSVDVRAILHTLRAVYGADWIADELESAGAK